MAKKFKLFNIAQVPFETIHEVSGSRQTLATRDDLISENIDALTKGTLKTSAVWDWHKHEQYDELGIVLKGQGKFYCMNETVAYKADDVIIIPANTLHRFEATADSEFYFVRIKI